MIKHAIMPEWHEEALSLEELPIYDRVQALLHKRIDYEYLNNPYARNIFDHIEALLGQKKLVIHHSESLATDKAIFEKGQMAVYKLPYGKINYGQIFLSKFPSSDWGGEDDMIDTILHEMTHAVDDLVIHWIPLPVEAWLLEKMEWPIFASPGVPKLLSYKFQSQKLTDFCVALLQDYTNLVRTGPFNPLLKEIFYDPFYQYPKRQCVLEFRVRLIALTTSIGADVFEGLFPETAKCCLQNYAFGLNPEPAPQRIMARM